MGYGKLVAGSLAVAGLLALGGASGVAGQADGPQAAGGTALYNRLEGEAVILRIVPKGTKVRRGQVVCELDSSRPRDRLLGQEVASRQAQVALADARGAREFAEAALQNYLTVELPRERQAARGALELAEAEWKLAEARVSEAGAGVDRTSTAWRRMEIEGIRARNARDEARARLDVLNRPAGPWRAEELKREVEKARAQESAREAGLTLAKSAMERLSRQIDLCRIVATEDGTVVSATPLGEGERVREGQMLLRIAP